MVWPFKKGKVMDFTSGKIPMPKNLPKTSDNDAVDLTSGDVGGLGFLGAMAGSSESDSGLGLREKHMKVKDEDIEYKLDSISRQIGKILDRLDLAEKKIDRNNRLGN
ncbi:MAG: hypothetical protein NT076_02900 [Candidatus Pacearchaeota archaeon]|nr:hypothetical protein [Candidatus Pacearchaeota archaeon]